MQYKDASAEAHDRFKKILQRRAARLNISPEEVAEAARFENEKPLFLLAADRRAELEGSSPETILQQYSQRLADSNYPTDDCLTPEEVVDLNELGRLPDERLAHVNNCNACSTLLIALLPSEKIVGDFIEMVRGMYQKDAVPADETNHALAMAKHIEELSERLAELQMEISATKVNLDSVLKNQEAIQKAS